MKLFCERKVKTRVSCVSVNSRDGCSPLNKSSFTLCKKAYEVLQKFGGGGGGAGAKFVGRSREDELTARVPAAGTELDDPIRAAHDVAVVFDNDERVSGVAQFEKQIQQKANIVPVQARCRFVEQVKCAFPLAFGKFEREFEALGFAAGKRRRGLSEFQVAESDFVERCK